MSKVSWSDEQVNLIVSEAIKYLKGGDRVLTSIRKAQSVLPPELRKVISSLDHAGVKVIEKMFSTLLNNGGEKTTPEVVSISTPVRNDSVLDALDRIEKDIATILSKVSSNSVVETSVPSRELVVNKPKNPTIGIVGVQPGWDSMLRASFPEAKIFLVEQESDRYDEDLHSRFDYILITKWNSLQVRDIHIKHSNSQYIPGGYTQIKEVIKGLVS